MATRLTEGHDNSRARLDGATIVVGNARVFEGQALPPVAAELEAQGKTLLFVLRDGRPIGVLAAMDTLRPDVPQALAELRQLGIEHIELPATTRVPPTP